MKEQRKFNLALDSNKYSAIPETFTFDLLQENKFKKNDCSTTLSLSTKISPTNPSHEECNTKIVSNKLLQKEDNSVTTTNNSLVYKIIQLHSKSINVTNSIQTKWLLMKTNVNRDDNDNIEDENSFAMTVIPKYNDNISLFLSSSLYDFPVSIQKSIVNNDDLHQLSKYQKKKYYFEDNIDDNIDHDSSSLYSEDRLLLACCYDEYYHENEYDEDDDYDAFESIHRLLFAWYHFGPCSTMPDTFLSECHIPSKMEIERFHDGDIDELHYEYDTRNNCSSSTIMSMTTFKECYYILPACNASFQVEYHYSDINSLLSFSDDEYDEDNDDCTFILDTFIAEDEQLHNYYHYEKNVLIEEFQSNNITNNNDDSSMFEMSYKLQRYVPTQQDSTNKEMMECNSVEVENDDDADDDDDDDDDDDEKTIEYNNMPHQYNKQSKTTKTKRLSNHHNYTPYTKTVARNMMRVVLKVYEGEGAWEFELNLAKSDNKQHTNTNSVTSFDDQYNAVLPQEKKLYITPSTIVPPFYHHNKVFLQAYEFNDIMLYELSVQQQNDTKDKYDNIQYYIPKKLLLPSTNNYEHETCLQLPPPSLKEEESHVDDNVTTARSSVPEVIHNVKLEAFEYQDIMLFELSLMTESIKKMPTTNTDKNYNYDFSDTPPSTKCISNHNNNNERKVLLPKQQMDNNNGLNFEDTMFYELALNRYNVWIQEAKSY